MSYHPSAIDTTGIELDRSLQDLLEKLSENQHDVWALERMRQGWTYGPVRDDSKLLHPCLVSYDELPENEKTVDRKAVVANLRAILALGYQIINPLTGATAEDSAVKVKDRFDESAGNGAGSHQTELKAIGVSRQFLRNHWENLKITSGHHSVSDLHFGSLCKEALKLGDNLLCVEIVQSLSTLDPQRAFLRQLLARAYLQMGDSTRARKILEEIKLTNSANCDTYSLIGRTFKDQWLEDGDSSHLKNALDHYLAAFARFPDESYPAINAASLSLLGGDAIRAGKLARTVLAMCERAQQMTGTDEWLEAILGEAHLCLGDLEQAAHHYRLTGSSSKLGLRDKCSTRRQARLLLNYLGRAHSELDACFQIPTLVAFAGHMIDSADRSSSRRRFPAEAEELVRQKIVEKLALLNAGIGYASSAAGSDILFLEAMIERDAEINILLSGPYEAFRKRSVDPIGGGSWKTRFDKVWEAAASREPASAHQPADDSLGYLYATKLMSGLAGMRAKELGLDLVAMAVWDGQPGDGEGGTADFVKHWNEFGKGSEAKNKIQLEVIRIDRLLDVGPAVRGREGGAETSSLAPRRGLKFKQMDQDIKAVLFADVAQFSQLTEQQLPNFFFRYMNKVSRLLAASEHAPIAVDTWGDALYMVFDEIKDAGLFALEMQADLAPSLLSEAERQEDELPHGLSMRIAVHAGPIFSLVDPITRKMAFTGRHVSQAARLEPVTKPGEIYGTEAFAALAFAEGISDFRCEYVGREKLAKEAGEIGVYQLLPKLRQK
jgi:class 3 adenylate cyclase/tetratricopeptide (TPR) repeat protein